LKICHSGGVGLWLIGVTYSVLFQEFPHDQLDAVSEAVSHVYQIPPFDARTKVHRGWGFLEQNVSDTEAQHICNALAEQGIAALVVANSDLRMPLEPDVMVGFSPHSEGFTPRLQSPTAVPRSIGWDDIAIVAAGGFKEEVVRRDTADRAPGAGVQLMGLGILLMTGMPTKALFGDKKKKKDKPVKAARFISFGQIVLNNGESLYFDPVHFEFSGLGAKKQLNTLLNFRGLVAEFARGNLARTNLGARCLLDNKSISAANYHGLKDFETELLWLLNSTVAAK